MGQDRFKHRLRFAIGITLISGIVASTASGQDVDAPIASGISETTMRAQPLNNAFPANFMGTWEPYDDGNWLNFDLDFTSGTEAIEMLEARVTYRDADGMELGTATVGQRDLSFAVLSRTDTAGAALPPAFDETGGRLDDFGSFGDQCVADIVIDSNGLLYAGGSGTNSTLFVDDGGEPLIPFASPSALPNGSLLSRYTEDGDNDDAFSANGLEAVSIANPIVENGTIRHGVNAIAVDALGNIWAGGEAWLLDVPSDDDLLSWWSVIRIDTNGVVEPFFGTQILFPETDNGRIADLALLSGSMIAVGSTEVEDEPRATLGIISANDAEIMVEDFLPDDMVSTYSAVVLDDEERIYVAGWFGPLQELIVDEDDELEDRTWFVARFLSDGMLDEDFGTAGRVDVAFPGVDRAAPLAMAIDGDDRIVTVGTVSPGPGISAQAAIVRMTSSGELDDTLAPAEAGTGIMVRDFGFPGLVGAGDVAIDAEDRIVVSIFTSDMFAAVRLLDDGDLDQDFDQNGIVALEHPDTPDQTGTRSTSVAIASGNRVVLGGCATNASGEGNFALMRLREDGLLDSNATQIPPATRVIVAFPDEALADDDRLLPFAGDPPASVDVELDVREVDTGEEWTLSFNEIPTPTFAPIPFTDGSTYVFPLTPPQLFVSLPDDDACAALDDNDDGDDETAPDPPVLNYRITVAHELRFGDIETHHRHFVNSLNNPSATNNQRYAYDIGVTDADGNLSRPLDDACEGIDNRQNTDSYIWGQPVIAIADGDIVGLDNSQPSNPRPGPRLASVPAPGNFISIQHSNGTVSNYYHMIPGSIPANFGMIGSCGMGQVCSVEQGDVIGMVGNSGNSSGPHLHFQLMDGPSLNNDDGLPIGFSNVMLDGMLQTNVIFHSRQVLGDILPIPETIELNPPTPSGAVGEAEPNDGLAEHHAVTPPTIVSGTISVVEAPTVAVRGDPVEDIYRFQSKTRARVFIRLEAAQAFEDLDVYLLNEGLQMLNPDRAGWGPGGIEEMVLTVPPGRFYVAVSNPEDGSGIDYELEIDIRPFAWQYSAKVVCGSQPDPENGRLVPGRYATTVNIHNPGGNEALVFKKLALAFPPVEQRPGRIHEIGEDTLGYDQAVKTDCADLELNALGGAPPEGETYYEGWVVVQSTEQLDVTAVYSAATLGPEGNVTGAHSIDVEQISEHGLGVDLSVTKSAEDFTWPFGDRLLHFILYTVDVANAGPAVAGNVRVSDTMALNLLNADGAAALLPFPLDLPPTGSLISIETLSQTASAAEFDIGDIAPGSVRSIRFWGFAAAGATGSPAFAFVENTVSVRAGEAELIEDDNNDSINTAILP